jgi:hypothetical protein
LLFGEIIMRMPTVTFALVISVAAFIAGCGGTPTNNAPAVNAVTTATATPKGPVVRNMAPTLTPVYKAYCDAWEKKDEAGIRKVYSADTLKEFEKEMKMDRTKSLLEHLDTDQPGGQCEVINEEITGDKAVGRIRSKAYPNGIEIVFVNENGEWKITNVAPGSVTQTAANSNTSK